MIKKKSKLNIEIIIPTNRWISFPPQTLSPYTKNPLRGTNEDPPVSFHLANMGLFNL